MDYTKYYIDIGKNVRINIMFSSLLLKEADKVARENFNGNRSAYLQNLVAKDLQNHNITL